MRSTAGLWTAGLREFCSLLSELGNILVIARALGHCRYDVCQQEGIGVTAGTVNGSCAGVVEVRNLSTSTITPHTVLDSDVMSSSGFYCYEGGCTHEQPARLFLTQHSLRQHQNRCHKGTKGEEVSMGRALKRMGEAVIAEEQEKRRRVEEVRISDEAARRTPEPAPVWSCIRYCWDSH